MPEQIFKKISEVITMISLMHLLIAFGKKFWRHVEHRRIKTESFKNA